MAKKNDSGADEVAEKLQAEQEAGGRGVFVDPTPNHAYTVAGVTAGEPTPETDPALAREAREALRLTETKFDRGEDETSVETTSRKASKDSTSGEAPKLTGDALDARGAELEIEGFSSMNADAKREAIAKAEAEASGNGS
jgi:hypothetical protein